jgi:cytochrome P450
MSTTTDVAASGPAGEAFSLDDLDWWTRPTAERDAVFAQYRAENPRPYFPELDLTGRPRGRGFTAITKYADVQEISKRPDDFASGSGVNIFDQAESLRAFLGSFIAMDNPEHARLRKIVSRGFTAKNMDLLRDKVAATSRELLSDISERGECDFVTDFAALLPLRIVDDMLGIPREYEKMIFDSTNIVLGASDPEYVADQSGRGVASELMRAATEMSDLLNDLAKDRIKNPKDDLISTLVAAGKEDNLTPNELASFFILLVGAGNETTRNAIAHALVALTQYPDQRTAWQADVAGVTPTAVEEIIRWASPVLYMRRTVTADGVRLGEQEFTEGDKVVLWYRSANRDEDVFENPNEFIATRNPNPPVGFGAPGPHFCLGAHLARLEVGVAYEAIFNALPDIHVVEEPVYLRSNFIHGIKHLKAEFTPTKLSL